MELGIEIHKLWNIDSSVLKNECEDRGLASRYLLMVGIAATWLAKDTGDPIEREECLNLAYLCFGIIVGMFRSGGVGGLSFRRKVVGRDSTGAVSSDTVSAVYGELRLNIPYLVLSEHAAAVVEKT